MKKTGVDNVGLPLRQILIGIVAALLAAVAGAGLVAYLIGKGTMDESNMKMAMVLMNLIASLVGCLSAVLLSRRSILVVAGSVAAGYFLLLLCTNLLFFDGGMEGVLWTVIMIVAGAAAAILVGLRGFRTKKRGNLRVRK